MIKLTPQLTKTWLAHDSVLAYTFADFSRTGIDAWIADWELEISAWSPDRPVRLLLDVRANNHLITPYAVTKARYAATLRPELTAVRTAVIIANFIGRPAITNAMHSLSNPKRERRLFLDLETALGWLTAPAFVAGRRALPRSS